MKSMNNQYLWSSLNIKGIIFNSRVFKSSDSKIEADLSSWATKRCDFLSETEYTNFIPEEKLLKIPEIYAKGALEAQKEGYKVCVIYGETGTFLGNFISPGRNQRTDQWGGKFENRMRLALSIIERIRETIGHELIVEFRMSGAEYVSGGYTVEEGVEIAKALDQKADIIYVAAGVDPQKDSFSKKYPSVGIMHGCNIRLASEIKKNVISLVATAGGLDDPKLMNDIIAAGKADILYSDMLL